MTFIFSGILPSFGGEILGQIPLGYGLSPLTVRIPANKDNNTKLCQTFSYLCSQESVNAEL